MVLKVHVCLALVLALSPACSQKSDEVSAQSTPEGAPASAGALPSVGASPLAAVGLVPRAAPLQAAQKRAAPVKPTTKKIPAPAVDDGPDGDAVPSPRQLVADATPSPQGKSSREGKSSPEGKRPADDAEDADDAAPKVKRRVVDESPRSNALVSVARGESMGLYGRWAKVPMRELYQRASLRWNEPLAVGRKLTIELSQHEKTRFDEARAAFQQERQGAYARTAAVEYVVRQGDSSWRIARRLGVPLHVLERMNEGRDLSRLQVGDKIQVPSKGGEG